MIKDNATITTKEIATITGLSHEYVVNNVFVTLLAINSNINIDAICCGDELILPYKIAILSAGAYAPITAMKIIEFLEKD